MKKFLLLFLLCLLLSACRAAPSAPDFAAEDFTAEIVLTLADREYALAYTREGDAETALLLAPETVAGVTAHRSADGTCTLTVGEVSFTAVAAERILLFTKLFAPPDGCLRFASETDGVRCFTGSDGADAYTVYTDLSGLPIRLYGRVDGQEYDIQILRIERRDRA